MSQESNSSVELDNNLTQFFFGAPQPDEIKQYFLRQKRLADLKVLESSPDIESSPELSESFELYLQQRKKKIENIKKGAAATGTTYSPTSSRADPQRDSMMSNMTTYGPDDTLMQCTDDSFMQNEKMCENTLHLNNVSEHLFDLTTLDDSIGEPRRSIKKGESFNDTHLMSIEAPSFMFNNTSLMSPNKHSPLQAVHANRPSTIMEVSELSLNRTGLSSYRTAESRSQISEDFKTADEGSYTEDMMIKMPKIRTFYDYNATSSDMSKDSLEVTRKTSHSEEMTKDSLNICDSSSGVDSSYDQRDESQNTSQGEEKLNDTLEQIEYMLAQHQKIQQQKTPRLITGSPSTPMPKPKSKHLQPKAFALPGSASKHSPLIKFSPHSRNSPQTNVASEPTFKRPMVSASKIPQPSLSSKKYQHIVSPISRYIKHTPGAPLSSTARALPGMESSPNRFNFRDSEGFPNENESMNANSGGGSSLPFLAKTKSSTVSHVFHQRDVKKTPGGSKIQSLLVNSSPTVTVHQGHVRTHDRPKVSQNNMFDETALSEQSFADLSLISGDVSVRVIEGAQRMK